MTMKNLQKRGQNEDWTTYTHIEDLSMYCFKRLTLSLKPFMDKTSLLNLLFHAV